MDLGRCPRCARPYSASEVVGFGVLRPRAASAGGPRMEFKCPDCACVVQLIPHGGGRYAPPGEPPPRVVPEADRRPPWADARPRDTAAQGAGAHRHPPREPPREPDPTPPPRSRTAPPPPTDLDPHSEEPMGPAEALELLGCKPSADTEEIERAFRERSLTCHPDKVAHLDADFQTLAERKFKRLRKALEILTS